MKTQPSSLPGFVCALIFSVSSAFASGDFPDSPDASLTPGSLCKAASEIRYPEQIKYCSRSVSSATKSSVMKNYDQTLGYQVTQRDRREFKIDHYIPLCAGGSNEPSNLWPQHESVYLHTDPLEPIICEKMAQGRLLQKDAVDFIRRAKANPYKAQALISAVQAL